MAPSSARARDRRMRPPCPLRYCAMMKKSPRKLALRKETVRALGDKELALIIGGDAQLAAETGDKQCTAVLAVLPRR